jgi:hypothetical protein
MNIRRRIIMEVVISETKLARARNKVTIAVAVLIEKIM